MKLHAVLLVALALLYTESAYGQLNVPPPDGLTRTQCSKYAQQLAVAGELKEAKKYLTCSDRNRPYHVAAYLTAPQGNNWAARKYRQTHARWLWEDGHFVPENTWIGPLWKDDPEGAFAYFTSDYFVEMVRRTDALQVILVERITQYAIQTGEEAAINEFWSKVIENLKDQSARADIDEDKQASLSKTRELVSQTAESLYSANTNTPPAG